MKSLRDRPDLAGEDLEDGGEGTDAPENQRRMRCNEVSDSLADEERTETSEEFVAMQASAQLLDCDKVLSHKAECVDSMTDWPPRVARAAASWGPGGR